jgi:hypothetical protein
MLPTLKTAAGLNCKSRVQPLCGHILILNEERPRSAQKTYRLGSDDELRMAGDTAYVSVPTFLMAYNSSPSTAKHTPNPAPLQEWDAPRQHVAQAATQNVAQDIFTQTVLTVLTRWHAQRCPNVLAAAVVPRFHYVGHANMLVT